jgi:hypothetical protein
VSALGSERPSHLDALAFMGRTSFGITHDSLASLVVICSHWVLIDIIIVVLCSRCVCIASRISFLFTTAFW